MQTEKGEESKEIDAETVCKSESVVFDLIGEKRTVDF